MKAHIYNAKGQGSVEYNPETRQVEVTHPDYDTRQIVKNYLTSERSITVPGPSAMLHHYNIIVNPPERSEYIDIALSEMFCAIGVHVYWGNPEDIPQLIHQICNEGASFNKTTGTSEARSEVQGDNQIIKITDLRKKRLAKSSSRIREYEDRFEYCLVNKYEEKYETFEAHSVQLGSVFPQLLDLGSRVVLVSIDFYKDQFTFDDIVNWLDQYKIYCGAREQKVYSLNNAHEIIQGLRFKGIPLVLYSLGNLYIKLEPTDYREVTTDFVYSDCKVDTRMAKDLNAQLKIMFNGKVFDQVPRIDINAEEDLLVVNGIGLNADYIEDFNGKVGFYQKETTKPVAHLVGNEEVIYISIDEVIGGSRFILVEQSY